MKLAHLIDLFSRAGCTKLYAKPLAENDNSKNQVYCGPGFEALNLFPNDGVVAGAGATKAIFKAKLRFGWLQTDGSVVGAPGAQLILYPQYPEVRLSGFLRDCPHPPSDLMTRRLPGRILFLGVTPNRFIVGFVVEGGSETAAGFYVLSEGPTAGVFHELPLPRIPEGTASRKRLLEELRRINRLGWIVSKQLDSGGLLRACNAPQCGGFTLEAELGIPKNSAAEPDYLGWEVKQHTVSHFDRVGAGTITLMTPEPTAGLYQDLGIEKFVRMFGYPDKLGRADRLNFGGIHKVGVRHATTQLEMRIDGYDRIRGHITDANGSIALVSPRGEVAAAWDFSGLLTHWSRKHSKAVYVPSQCRKEPQRQYRYGHKVRLAQGTDSLRLLAALASGRVYYDPGIKLEKASSSHPTSKRRSQFRISSKNIGALYEKLEVVEV